MSDVVRIILLKLVAIDIMLPSKFGFPEDQGLFHGQADALEIKA